MEDEIKEEKDPKGDGEMNVLIVGQSASYYWTDELWGMLDAMGTKSRVCNVYYSGCPLKRWKRAGFSLPAKRQPLSLKRPRRDQCPVECVIS